MDNKVLTDRARRDWVAVLLLGLLVGVSGLSPDRLSVTWPIVLIYLGGIFVTLAILDRRAQAEELAAAFETLD